MSTGDTKNISWNSLALPRRGKGVTLLFTTKFVNMAHHFISTHLRQIVLYCEDVNKNAASFFVLPFLEVFYIYQDHYLPKENDIVLKSKGLMTLLLL